MKTEKPILFELYPNLEGKVPWIPLLNKVPTPVERLTELEKDLGLNDGQIYIKRDDKDHDIYGGNKLRKFEFIFGKAVKKKKKGMATIGGIGTNHGLACAIVAKQLNMKCNLFLFPQPLTWHVQRSLLLYDYFGAKLHLSKGFVGLALKSFLFQFFHPKHYLMLPGGSLLFGKGSPNGTIGFINAALELSKQIKNGELPEPDAIFVAGGSGGTAGGLIAGCKLAGLKTKIHCVQVSMDWVVNKSTVALNANKALEYIQKKDKSFPKIKVEEDDFEVISGYLGSEYGVKTIRSQNAVDKVWELEGKKRGFKLETTYTGKTMAAMLDYLEKDENKSKIVLFWNTYNSNDLDGYLRETNFNYKKLPKKFHQFYEKVKFQCWQIVNCPKETREKCEAYLNHEYRFWKVTECKLDKEKQEKAKEVLSNVIKLEDA